MKIYLYVKRFFDFIFSLLAIFFLSPFFITIFLVILFSEGKPIFFRQNRIGLKGKLFKIYKFRTMRNGTELEGSGYYTYDGDSRITKIGYFLRRYS